MSNSGGDKLADAVERISMLLGALYASQLGDLEQSLKADRLSRCGFSNTEIADLLGTSANTINVALHKARRRKASPKSSKRRAPRKR